MDRKSRHSNPSDDDLTPELKYPQLTKEQNQMIDEYAEKLERAPLDSMIVYLIISDLISALYQKDKKLVNHTKAVIDFIAHLLARMEGKDKSKTKTQLKKAEWLLDPYHFEVVKYYIDNEHFNSALNHFVERYPVRLRELYVNKDPRII